jgi:Fe-S cluster assembly iron-binding protein IscA
MLDVSPLAAEALSNIRDQQGLPTETTVRISAVDGSPQLQIKFVDAPLENDEVAEAFGLPYAVSPELADRLGRSTLDFESGDAGEGGFVLR